MNLQEATAALRAASLATVRADQAVTDLPASAGAEQRAAAAAAYDAAVAAEAQAREAWKAIHVATPGTAAYRERLRADEAARHGLPVGAALYQGAEASRTSDSERNPLLSPSATLPAGDLPSVGSLDPASTTPPGYGEVQPPDLGTTLRGVAVNSVAPPSLPETISARQMSEGANGSFGLEG